MNLSSSWPYFDEGDIQAVGDVLRSGKVNYWTGNEGNLFEAEFSAFVGTRYGIAVTNGTVALDLAWIAIGLRAGDEVIVTPRTFIASISSIINAGAKPIFVDVDHETQNIAVENIEPSITCRTKAVLCVHFAGMPCDMDPINEIAQRHNLAVIEDCAQAHGARYKGRSVGSIGDIGCWSFCQDKIISTGGEGGMVTTNHKEYWLKMWSYKDHGKGWSAVFDKPHPLGYRWLHESFGTNWRMTEIQAVLGRRQLQKLPCWSEIRLRYAKKIWSAANSFSITRAPRVFCNDACADSRVCGTSSGCVHGAYKCYVFVEGEADLRNALLQDFASRGVVCSTGGCPEVYMEAAFEGTGLRPTNRLPVAQKLGETSLMFQCHPSLEEAEVDEICAIFRDVVQRYDSGADDSTTSCKLSL